MSPEIFSWTYVLFRLQLQWTYAPFILRLQMDLLDFLHMGTYQKRMM